MTEKVKKQIQGWMYDTLVQPLITEKTTAISGLGQVGFVVNSRATKNVVKVAIEAIYNVKVDNVNILNVKGKTKKFRGKTGTRKNIKKAYVRLAKGEKIEITKS